MSRKKAKLSPGVCIHCKKEGLVKARRLCIVCYGRESIRNQYPNVRVGAARMKPPEHEQFILRYQERASANAPIFEGRR